MALTWGQRAALVGAAMVVVGAPLDWVVARNAFGTAASRSGLDLGDGVLTLLAGVAAASITWRGDESETLGGWRPRVQAAVAGLGLVVFLLAGRVADQIESANSQLLTGAASVETGAGLGLTALGGMVLMGTGAVSVVAHYWVRNRDGAAPDAGRHGARPESRQATAADTPDTEGERPRSAAAQGATRNQPGRGTDAGRTPLDEHDLSSDAADRLRELRDLRDEGVITEDEFERKKQDLLDEL